MKILYVENHAIFAAQVCQQFLSAHAVRVVSSLAAAREALATNRFDLLIVDYDLDDGKGDELVRACRASYPELRIIAASAHDAGNAALLKAGASAACGKMQFNAIQNVIDGLYLVPHELVRQDDNGNQFVVGTYRSRADAVTALNRLESGIHKQTYWVRAANKSDNAT